MQTFKDVWGLVDEFCATKVGDVAYSMWIHTIEPVDFKNGEAVLKVPHNIHKKVIDQTYAELIKTAFQQIMGFPVGLRVLCEENPDLTGNHAIPAGLRIYLRHLYRRLVQPLRPRGVHGGCRKAVDCL